MIYCKRLHNYIRVATPTRQGQAHRNNKPHSGDAVPADEPHRQERDAVLRGCPAGECVTAAALDEER
jgi:hypothetical protein